MRKALRAAVLALGVVVAALAVAPVPAHAQDRSVGVANSATFRPCARTTPSGQENNQANCANGSFLSFFISPPPTNFRGDTPNWPDGLDNNRFRIRLAECNSQNLRILGVYTYSDVAVQVNVFQQGALSDGQWGNCSDDGYTNGRKDVVWEIFGSTPEFGTTPLRYSGRLWVTTPSVAYDLSTGTTAAGVHVKPDGSETPLRDCLVDPAQCPLRTDGQLNHLILYVNGMENDACPGANVCSQTWLFRLDSGGSNFMTLEETTADTGYQRVRLRLPSTLIPGVQYSLGQQNAHQQLYSYISQSNLRFRFG